MTRIETDFRHVTDVARDIEQRRIASLEIVDTLLERIDELNGVVNAFVHVDADGARAAARAADIEIAHGGYRGVLHGIPVAYKDIIDVQGLPTTAASRVMAGYVPERDSTVAARLRQAGAICLGKLNTQEFASGTMELFGDTRNPWDTSRTSGGSSAGSAAAVAAGLVPLSVGTDTGGSVRMPAGFCGVVGLKPTYGRVSRAGIVPLSWSMDHPGPFGRTVLDTAVLLQAMAGHDAADPSTAIMAVPEYRAGVRADLGGVRVGVPRAYFFEGGDAEVIAAVDAAIALMRDLGALVLDVDIPHAGFGQAAAWAIAYSEALAVHRANLRTRHREYGRMFLRKVASAAFLTVDELLTAHQIRQVITDALCAVLQRVDVVVTPTNLFPAHRIGASFPNAQRPLGIYPEGDLTLLMRPVSLTGLPALSVPCGFTRAGLPIGMQLIARSFAEQTLIRVGHAYELAAGWSERRPPLTEGPAEPTASPATASPSGVVIAEWVLEWSRLAELSYLGEADADPIARSIGPVKAHLAEAAHGFAAKIEVATRPAPITA